MRFNRLPLREYFHRHCYHHYNSKNSSLDRPQSPSSSGALATASDASPMISPSQMLPTLDIALDMDLDTMAQDIATEELETVFACQQAFENRRRDPLGLDLDEFLDSLLDGLMTSPI